MSPRAACRLDTLGFAEVYDYVPGKADWRAHGLPVEGEHADLPTAGGLARDDIITCRLADPVGAVREQVEASPYGGHNSVIVVPENSPGETADAGHNLVTNAAHHGCEGLVTHDYAGQAACKLFLHAVHAGKHLDVALNLRLIFDLR